MGASNQFFKFDEIMMMKGLKSQTYRLNNFDNANIDKSIKAAEKQIKCINTIIEKKDWIFFLPSLRKLPASDLKTRMQV